MKKLISFIFIVVTIMLLGGCSKASTPAFQKMVLPKTPNYYLVCPEKYCNVTPDAFSPVYPVSAEDLFNTFNQIIAKEPRANFVYSIPEEGQFQLVKRTLLNLPDDIGVQFIALSDTTSTLAIYSKSRYLPFDFGENKRRIQGWLVLLQEKAAAGQ
jgi:uncharacterized protein (DUF1499 family)